MIVVVSTGFAPPTADRCRASVKRQTEPHAHVWTDAADQLGGPRCALDNITTMISVHADPGDVIVWLDLDDWLAHDMVLERVAEIYRDPNVWLTYGSYVLADGRPGICRPYETDDYRGSPWLASHLKTFRAGLFNRIGFDDLHHDGRWLELAIDQALMLPMLEMSGPAHVRFVPDILCVYNYGHSFEHNASADDLRREQDAVRVIRGKPRRARLEAL